MAVKVKDDLTGRIFSNLSVVGRAPDRKKPSGLWMDYWHCTCSCGNECEVRSDHLKSGRVVSCGCYRKVNTSKVKKQHGMTGTKTYNVWLKMVSRCTNDKDPAYPVYSKEA